MNVRAYPVTALVPVSRPEKGDESPLEHAVRVIGELNEQPRCRICQRKFTMTPMRLDLCARCSE